MIKPSRKRKRGLTLVHIQAAIAVCAITAAAVGTTIATMYRIQHSTDDIRQRDASIYRFERQFRDDAHQARSAIYSDKVLKFGGLRSDVKYTIESGRLVRSSDFNGSPSHQVLYVPDDMTARFGADTESQRVSFSLVPKVSGLGQGGYRVESVVGRFAATRDLVKVAEENSVPAADPSVSGDADSGGQNKQ